MENQKKINMKKILGIIFLLVIFFVSIIIFIQLNNLDKLKNIEDTGSYINQTNEIETSHQDDEIPQGKIPEIVDIDIPEKMENYNIIGQLVIEKIQLENYILHTTDDNSLKLSITRYYGPQPNKVGNFCVVGHNKKDQFNKLKKLEVEDTFYIIDQETHEKVNYKIYDIYTVKPTDLSCLNQETNKRREVTLITCNPRRVN